MAAKREEFYQPGSRYRHCSVQIGDNIIIWGGHQEGLPKVHDSPVKRLMAGIVEVFQCKEGRWQRHATTGPPPLGIVRCASCSIGRKIYYFGGYCNHDQCLHNSLHELNIDGFTWTQHFATNDKGPMKKCSCGIVGFYKTLLVIGGQGLHPQYPQRLVQYDGRGVEGGQVRTNEHHMYDLETKQWSIPYVTGDKPPPVNGFSLKRVAEEKALMYGGNTKDGHSSQLFTVTFVRDTCSVHWERLVPCGPDRPVGRCGHAVTIIKSPLMGNRQILVLVAGGWNAKDSWLLSIGEDVSWIQVKNMPESVANRHLHSINTVAVSHSCVWLMVIGKDPPYPDVLVLELNLSPNGQWEPSTVLRNDEIYQGYTERYSIKFPTQHQTMIVAGLRKRVTQLQKQLQQANTMIEEAKKDVLKRDLQMEYTLQQLWQKDQMLLEKEQIIHEKDKLLQEKNRKIQDKDQRLRQAQQQVQLSTEAWVVSRKELTLTHEMLGSGAYGVVMAAVFRGLRVAAKCLHEDIVSEYNLHHFLREMNIAAKVRHPNLLLFIGATTWDRPLIILTEVMPTSLSVELHKGQISRRQIKSIATDVSCGLNYLHQWKPDPIIHRDISSPNILMEKSSVGLWRAKISDFGSANFWRQVTRASVNPGNPAYSAPEASDPEKHTPKMDVYSFGVLLIEMSINQSPKSSIDGRAKQAGMVQWHQLAEIIQVCLTLSADDRPMIATVMDYLRQL